ncbi:MAG: TolC family protein [Polyangiales bacterium]
MRTIRWMILAAATLLPRAAAAQADAPSWDEARAVARAVSRSPEVRRAAAVLEEARARDVYARVSPVGNPVVSLRAMVGVPDLPAATYALTVGVPFDVSGARTRRRDEVAWGVREAEAQLEAALNDARSRTRLSWVELGLADEAVRVSRSRLETARALVEQAQARAEALAVTALDLALTRRDAALAEAELAVAARHRAQSLTRFREVLDLGPEEPAEVSPLPPPAMPPMDLAQALAAARAGRAEPRRWAASAARQRASAGRLRAESVAPLLLNGEVEWQGYSQTSVGVSAQWALPLARTAQGERAEALAGARTALVEGELARRAVEREVAGAYAALEHSLAELAALSERAIPAAQEAVSLTEALRERGAAELFRVLAAQQELAAARGRRLEALREAWRARLELDRATSTNPHARSVP